MVAIFLQTLPFFLIIGVGFLAVKYGALPRDATQYISTFVFYFALSAMLFQFASALSLQELWNKNFALAYGMSYMSVYILALLVALYRKENFAIAAVEAQTAVIGNVGFMGIPMLVLLFGASAAGPVLLVLALDLLIFSSLIVISLTIAQSRHVSLKNLIRVIASIFKNPMILSISFGLIWGAIGIELPEFIAKTLTLLGGAATPTALFVIGMSLAGQAIRIKGRGSDKAKIALWLSLLKLIILPLLVAFFALYIFNLDRFNAAILIAATTMPTAGNIFLIAQNFNIGAERASLTIFVSTLLSIITLTLWITFIKTRILS